MTATLIFRVCARPLPLKRHRLGRGRVFDPSAGDKRDWLNLARVYAPIEPLTGPLVVHVQFTMPRPKSHLRTGRFAGLVKASAPAHHTSTPDVDNLLKCVAKGVQCFFRLFMYFCVFVFMPLGSSSTP